MSDNKRKPIFTLKKISLAFLGLFVMYAFVAVFYSWVVSGGSVGNLLSSVKTAKAISSVIQLFVLGLVWWNWEVLVVLPSKPKAHKALRDARNNLCLFGLILLIIFSLV